MQDERIRLPHNVRHQLLPISHTYKINLLGIKGGLVTPRANNCQIESQGLMSSDLSIGLSA